MADEPPEDVGNPSASVEASMSAIEEVMRHPSPSINPAKDTPTTEENRKPPVVAQGASVVEPTAAESQQMMRTTRDMCL